MSQKGKPVNLNVKVGDTVRAYTHGPASSERRIEQDAQDWVKGEVMSIEMGGDGRMHYVLRLTDGFGIRGTKFLDNVNNKRWFVPVNDERYHRTEVLHSPGSLTADCDCQRRSR